jgi:hypothetical protein
MDSALEVGGANGIGRLMALLGSLTAGQEDLYAEIFAELDPEAFLVPLVEEFQAARDFGSRLFACDPEAGDESRPCVWSEVSAHQLKRDGDDALPFKFGTGTRLRLGGGVPFGDGWSVAGALGYDDLGHLGFGNGRAAGGNGHGIHGGLGVRKAFGDDERGAASLGVTMGRQKMDMARRQTVFETAIGEAEVESDYLEIVSRVGYRFGSGSVTFEPAIEASMIHLTNDDFEEEGLGGLGVVAEQASDWFGTLAPQLTVRAELSSFARLSLTGGALFHDTSRIVYPFRLVGTDPASDPAMIGTLIDDRALLAGADFEILGNEHLSVRVGYRGEFGKTITSQTANFRLRWAF